MTVHVKICGLRTTSDVEACVELGASALGLNFIASSPRSINAATARQLSRAAHARNARTLVIGVVADLTVDAMQALIRDAELDCLQLHGDETAATLQALLPHAYKATRVRSAADVTKAREYPGNYMLVDAWAPGTLGGSGTTFDWELVTGLARERRLTLAGGLTPENVANAVGIVKPFAVDVASGVEVDRSPGVKDLSKVARFIEAAHAASREATPGA